MSFNNQVGWCLSLFTLQEMSWYGKALESRWGPAIQSKVQLLNCGIIWTSSAIVVSVWILSRVRLFDKHTVTEFVERKQKFDDQLGHWCVRRLVFTQQLCTSILSIHIEKYCPTHSSNTLFRCKLFLSSWKPHKEVSYKFLVLLFQRDNHVLGYMIDFKLAQGYHNNLYFMTITERKSVPILMTLGPNLSKVISIFNLFSKFLFHLLEIEKSDLKMWTKNIFTPVFNRKNEKMVLP